MVKQGKASSRHTADVTGLGRHTVSELATGVSRRRGEYRPWTYEEVVEKAALWRALSGFDVSSTHWNPTKARASPGAVAITSWLGGWPPPKEIQRLGATWDDLRADAWTFLRSESEFARTFTPRELRYAGLRGATSVDFTEGLWWVWPAADCPTWYSHLATRAIAPHWRRRHTAILGKEQEERFEMHYALLEADALRPDTRIVVDQGLGVWLDRVGAPFHYRTYSDTQLRKLLDSSSRASGQLAVHLSSTSIGADYLSSRMRRPAVNRDPRVTWVTVSWSPARRCGFGSNVGDLYVVFATDSHLVLDCADKDEWVDIIRHRGATLNTAASLALVLPIAPPPQVRPFPMVGHGPAQLEDRRA